MKNDIRKTMQEKVQEFIQNKKLLNQQSPIIVGVSGGADSVVLLHILMSLGYGCIVAHCNFHLREEASDSDEKFVHALSKSLQIPYHKVDFDTQLYAKQKHISIEMAARDLRYAWFRELMEQHHAQAIAVGHHADDSIETLLLNLIRGTGLKGLSGIPSRNKEVVRPLLCCSRPEILDYLADHKLEHITDASNESLLYQRNKVRNVVLPLLEEMNPSVRQTLYQNQKHFEGSWAIYEQAILQIKKELMTIGDELVSIDIEGLKKQAQRTTVLYELLHPYGFHPSTIAQIDDQLDSESGRQFFSERHRLVIDRAVLLISNLTENAQCSYSIQKEDKVLEHPIEMSLRTFPKQLDFKFSKEKNCVHLDASKLTFPLQRRHWEEGDTFYPLGMDQKKKLSDFFINNKLSLLEKEKCWILLSEKEVVWIVGMRLDNRFKVTERSEMVLEIKVAL